MAGDQIKVPTKLFRYRNASTSYFEEELARAVNYQKIFLTSVEKVNDPFEFNPSYIASPVSEVLINLKKTFGSNPTIDKSFVEERMGRKISRKEYRTELRGLKPNRKTASREIESAKDMVEAYKNEESLACFSETDTSIPMWAHYSNNHTGVCIEFDVDPRQLSESQPFPQKVIYTSNRPQISTTDVQALLDRAQVSDKEKRVEKTYDALLLTKATDWSYEKEWRVTERMSGKSNYVKISSLSVTGIKLGLRTDDKTAERILDDFGGKVRIHKAELCENNFSFNFRPLN